MKKIATLNQVVPVAEKLPAISKPVVRWRAFNSFVAEADKLREYFDELRELRDAADPNLASGDVEDDAQWLAELVAKCKAGFETFDRADNYDDEGLSETHIAKRLGVMIGAFPNANPGTPKDYARMLVEHVAAIEGLTDVALESACREIVETKTFAPAIAEVMSTIGDHVRKWQDRRRALSDVEQNRQLTMAALMRREHERDQREHQERVRQATHVARCAMETTQRLAKELEAAKAALVSLMQRHAEAEKRESELLRELRRIARTPEEAEAEAATAALAAYNGSGAKLM